MMNDTGELATPLDWYRLVQEDWTRECPASLAPAKPNYTQCHEVIRYTQGYSIAGTAVFGLVGNMISAFVLCMPQMRSAYSVLLTALTIADSLQLGVHLVFIGLPSMGVELVSREREFYTMYGLMMAGWIAFTASAYLTVLLSVERYIAVCQPFRALAFFPSKRKTVLYTLVIAGFAALFNWPKWYHQTLIPNPEYECKLRVGLETNYTSEAEIDQLLDKLGVVSWIPKTTKIVSDVVYRTLYIVWGNAVVNFVVPVVLLMLLNTRIYREIRATNRTKQILTKSQQHDLSITTMLVFVVAIFTVCNVLFIIDALLADGFSSRSFDESCWVFALNKLKTYLYSFNAAINFVVYCVCGSKFRQQLKRLVCQIATCQFSSTYYKNRLRQSQRRYYQNNEISLTSEYRIQVSKV